MIARGGSWVVLAGPLGFDKLVHVVVSAGLVVVLAGRLGARRAAALTLAAGVALEVVHGTQGTLGLDLPAPIGGTAELADIAADLVGIALGLLALVWIRRRDEALRRRLRHRRRPRPRRSARR